MIRTPRVSAACLSPVPCPGPAPRPLARPRTWPAAARPRRCRWRACDLSGQASSALCGVRGGMRKGSPACRVRVGCPWIIICTVPAMMYPTSSPGMDVPAGLDAAGNLGEHLDDLPSGNRRCLVLELGPLEPGRECVGRLRGVLSGQGRHGWDHLTSRAGSGGRTGGSTAAQEGQQLRVDFRRVGNAHDVRASVDLDVVRVRQGGVQPGGPGPAPTGSGQLSRAGSAWGRRSA